MSELTIREKTFGGAMPAGPAWIEIDDGRGLPKRLPLDERLVLGREGAGLDADLTMDCAYMSGRHAQILRAGGHYLYEDLGSANGSRINGDFYGPGQPARILADGDEIRIGMPFGKGEGIRIIFHLGLPAGSLMRPAFEAPSEGGGQSPAAKAPSDGGQSPAAKALSDGGQSPAAKVPSDKGRSFVHKAPSDGEKQRILSEETRQIRGEDPEIRPDPARRPARRQVGAPVSGDPLIIDIEERTVRDRLKKKTLLKDIHLQVQPGELVLILGGSGAGKTTFMNAVMGYEKARGRILHGDLDLYEDYETVKYDIGFVPQRELIRSADTVENALTNAAEMKMPAHCSREKIRQRVEEVMDQLGLTPERSSQVHQISGGQQKRLSIAVELIAGPGLFFLDEPDSGLDGIMARSLMENLREIADQGKIVMVITHGPDRAADLFDKVIVLAKSSGDGSGHCAFYGSPKEALAFFDCQSLEGVVKRINRPDEGGDGLADHYIEKFETGRKGQH